MQNFYIHSFEAKNYRHFESLFIKFNNKFNFITGSNGCGKTSVLHGVMHCFNQSNHINTRFLDDSSIATNLILEDGVEPQKISVGFGVGSFRSKEYRGNTFYQTNLPTTSLIDFENWDKYQFERTYPYIIPLNITSDRNIRYKFIEGTRRILPNDEQRDGYLNGGLTTHYTDDDRSVKQWMINRYAWIDKGWARDYKQNWDHLIKYLPNLGPSGSDFEFVEIKDDLEPMFCLYGQECYLEELSAGFQAIFSVVAKIIEWIETTNSEGQRFMGDATGTVLIDELDLHLHPEWQFNIRDGLEALFPNLQFIVTTHSPHLLASAKEGEVIIMSRETGKTEYHFEPSNKRYSGWNTDQILEDVMGVKSLKNKDYERLIDEAFDAYESKDKAQLLSIMEKLKKITHSDDTIVQVLEIKMASLELE
ncbi:AAA family ATPase [Acinetobacter tandoii]